MSNTKFQLAQLNLASFRLPPEDPVNADFVNSLDRINAIAEAQPGFVWRFTGEGNNAMDVAVIDNPLVIPNLSVWTDIESLQQFAYRNNAHRDLVRRRKEWFNEMAFYLVLWWVPEGHIPTVTEAMQRLNHLRDNGASPFAFTFRQAYEPTDVTD